MKFLTFCLSATLFIPNVANAQTAPHKCGFDDVQHDLAKANPNYAQEVAAYKQSIRTISTAQTLQNVDNNGVGRRSPEAVLTIPVVFHIIHSGEAVGVGRNISVARVQQQIAQLNADYAKTNADISQLPSQFSGIAANCEVQFCLAAITPQGAATNGISRHQYSNIANRQYIESTIKPATTWNANRYLNVWVCEIPQTGSGFVLGYAYLPTASMVGSNIDGFVIDYSYVGTNAAVNSKGRTSTHEIGHYLGLPHPWGDDEGDCPGTAGYEDDNIADTPPTSEPNYTPSNGVCNFTPVFCNNTVFGSNFMDYGNDNCMHAFSTGQKNVMRSILTGLRAQITNNAVTTCALAPVTGCSDPVITAFTMGFETTESTTGWVTENTNNDTNGSAPVTWGIASGVQPDGDYGPFAGNQYARYFYNNDGTTAANDWLFSPCLSLKTGRNYSLSFYTAVGSLVSGGAPTVYPEKLACYLTNAQNSAAGSVVTTLNNVGTLTNAYPSYQQKTANFTVSANGNYYLGFKCYSAANNYVLLLDNINLTGSLTATESIDFENEMKIYPNPVSDILTVEIPNNAPLKDASIQVSDMLGRVLYTVAIRAGEYRHFINPTSEWAPGIYTLTLNTDGSRISKRFAVQR